MALHDKPPVVIIICPGQTSCAGRTLLARPTDLQERDLSSLLVTRGGGDLERADRGAAGPGPGADKLSLETRRVYDGAWQAFVAWCASQDGPAVLPVPPERVVAYIDSLPPSLGPNGLKLRLAAIARHHRDRGSPSPTAHAAMRAALSRDGYRALDAFVAYRDPGIGSEMSRRLGLDR